MLREKRSSVTRTRRSYIPISSSLLSSMTVPSLHLCPPLFSPFAPPFVLLDPRTCWLGPRERAACNTPARPGERIKRVFVRAWASCLSNTSYLPEVSGDSVTVVPGNSVRFRGRGQRSTFLAGSTPLLKRPSGQATI